MQVARRTRRNYLVTIPYWWWPDDMSRFRPGNKKYDTNCTTVLLQKWILVKHRERERLVTYGHELSQVVQVKVSHDSDASAVISRDDGWRQQLAVANRREMQVQDDANTIQMMKIKHRHNHLALKLPHIVHYRYCILVDYYRLPSYYMYFDTNVLNDPTGGLLVYVPVDPYRHHKDRKRRTREWKRSGPTI